MTIPRHNRPIPIGILAIIFFCAITLLVVQTANAGQTHVINKSTKTIMVRPLLETAVHYFQETFEVAPRSKVTRDLFKYYTYPHNSVTVWVKDDYKNHVTSESKRYVFPAKFFCRVEVSDSDSTYSGIEVKFTFR